MDTKKNLNMNSNMNMKTDTNQNTHRWKNDSRLKHISPERLQLLTDLADRLKQAPPNQKPAAFLAVQKKAASMDIRFNDEERELLMSVLTEDLSSEDLKKVHLIQKLASQMHNTNNRTNH